MLFLCLNLTKCHRCFLAEPNQSNVAFICGPETPKGGFSVITNAFLRPRGVCAELEKVYASIGASLSCFILKVCIVDVS